MTTDLGSTQFPSDLLLSRGSGYFLLWVAAHDWRGATKTTPSTIAAANIGALVRSLPLTLFTHSLNPTHFPCQIEQF